MSEEAIPTITVRLSRDGKTVRFSCPDCGEVHTHGAPVDVEKAEHRVSHCRNKAAFPNGYFIKVGP